MLPESAAELLEKLKSNEDEKSFYDELEIFKSGFSAGVLMMVEVMGSRESNFGWDI